MKRLGASWLHAFTLFSLGLGQVWAEPTAWRVGMAGARITPEGPMPMCGYGPRISDGVLDELHAKAMGRLRQRLP